MVTLRTPGQHIKPPLIAQWIFVFQGLMITCLLIFNSDQVFAQLVKVRNSNRVEIHLVVLSSRPTQAC